MASADPDKAIHWTRIGSPKAKDAVIMQWARANDHVVFTHDLGFSALLPAVERADIKVVDRGLSQVPDVPPIAGDELPVREPRPKRKKGADRSRKQR